ncbi:hypothetical protein DEO72_LG10g452 [Vigna unguiculata]|uniref:Uncharacterized protein n=1 Tax=Vigna unguiculata TaxID=3917 RepID=A0A4D6N5Z4_VIGUN|nr:hypothetical protein DEO72_LG10g452 [Vigna unguiculata]
MGVSPNPKVFLSDKDLIGANIVDPELGCQAFIQEDHHLFKLKHLSVQERHQDNKDRHQEHQHQRNSIIVITKPVCPITLKLDIPSSYVGSENEDDDGYATPTSSEKKIPAIPECPGAPKKTKAKPAAKRKAFRRRTLLDLTQDLESLFPVPCVADLGGGGVKKRVKLC